MDFFRRGIRRTLSTLVILALLISGGGWYYFNQYIPTQAAPPEEAIKKIRVQQGDLTLSASGSGELVPAHEVALGFQAGGVLVEVLVEVGDHVNEGDVLARLDDTEAQYQVAQAQIVMRQAELQLVKLVADPSAADLASSQATLTSAQAEMANLIALASAEELAGARNELTSAQAALAELSAGPSDQEIIVAKADIEKAQVDLQQAQAEYDKYAWKQGFEASPQSAALQQATIDYERVKANYELTISESTVAQVSSALAKVAQAQAALNELEQGPDPADLIAAEAKVAQAQAALEELLAGTSAMDLESAELDVEQARLNLTSAQQELAERELRAPFAAVVTAVEGSTGELVGTSPTSPFITLADLEEPWVRFWVEESDLTSIAVGNPVNIIFEALPDNTFTGEIIRVKPVLVTISGTPAIQSWASVDLSGHPAQLLSGMTVDEVEIIAAEARDVLLVPIQALREMGSDQYAVFVVESDGDLELRQVEVGLKDLVNAEILSGLELGEQISLGVETSSQGLVQPPAEGSPPTGGIIRMIGG